MPPHGPARVVGESFVDERSELSIHVSAVAGSWVALRFASFLGVGGSESGTAFNAASGRSYSFWDASNGPVVPPEKPAAHALNRALLNGAGQMALAVREGEVEQIVGIEPNGTRRVLDSAPPAQIPPTSLRLNGSTVQWMDGGSTRTATL